MRMGIGPFLNAKLDYALNFGTGEMMSGFLTKAMRNLCIGLLFLTVGLCSLLVILPPFLDRVYYGGPASSHFDGARFFNPGIENTMAPPTGGSRGNFIVRLLLQNDGRPPWPDSVPVTQGYGAAEATPCPVTNPRVAENWKRCVDKVDPTRMFVTWIGHATVLIQADGINILTDPIYSDRAGPFGVGPKRVANPGIAFDDLPKIDLVVVSHNHYDHMDVATLKKLYDRDKPLVVTSLGNDAILKKAGVPATARDWNIRVTVKPGIDVIVTRNHHWSSRWGSDRNRALWSSFVFVLPGGNVMFSGDTGFGDGQWPVEAAKYGQIRLALIPIGAFRFVPGQMGTGSHVGPIDAAEVFVRSKARTAIPIHWGTFRLSYEAYDTPPKLLASVNQCRNIRDFNPVAIGKSVEIPALNAPVLALPPPWPLGPKCLDTDAVRALK
jgi:L-ascorbate metabolism protein UlaG (beta-lactamase superfamily)